MARVCLSTLAFYLGSLFQGATLSIDQCIYYTGFFYLSLKLIESLAPFKLPENTATTVLAVIATDFVCYWQHRISHRNRYLWFFHEVHHSSKYFNLTTSFRLHWLGRVLAPIYFAPLVLVGFSPEQVTLFFVFNLFYQALLKFKWVEFVYTG